jgi:hypothetical protein
MPEDTHQNETNAIRPIAHGDWIEFGLSGRRKFQPEMIGGLAIDS